VGDDGGIDGVSLGQVVHRFGEVAHLAGVDDDGGEPFGQQGGDCGLLVRTRRFEDYAFGGESSGPGHEFRDAGRSVSETLLHRSGADMGIEKILRDVDADDDHDDALHGELPL
jgi:hypothetical protein